MIQACPNVRCVQEYPHYVVKFDFFRQIAYAFALLWLDAFALAFTYRTTRRPLSVHGVQCSDKACGEATLQHPPCTSAYPSL